VPVIRRRSKSAVRRLFVAGALALAACQREGGDLPAPAFGTATCAACGSVIDDPRFAAQYRLAEGTVKSFDDPACLFDALRSEARAPDAVRFHTYTADSWVGPSEVWFARTPSTTAHGSGWAAYPSFAAAQEAVTAAGSGEIASFEQAKTRLRRTS